MGMLFVQAPMQRQEQRKALTREQIQAKRITNRMVLLQPVWGADYGDQFTVDERCPSCQARVTLEEILRDFTADPADTFITCPSCRTRFQPVLRELRTVTGGVEIAF
jgi:DNA-directed RNA polymerase subunit M/transcription elongation factor TFIIS